MTDTSDGTDATGDDRGLDRRSLLGYAGTGAVAAGLAGCQAPENPVPGGNLRVDDDTELEARALEDAEGALEGEVLRIGVLAPMNIVVGESMWNAARQAADDINDAGGILGAEVQVELGDTEVSPGVAESEHRRLITQERCDMTVGVFLGSALMQTMPSIGNLEKIHITTGSAEPRVGQLASNAISLTDDDPADEHERFKYHFRAGPMHLLDLADAMMELLEMNGEEYGWERVAVLTEDIGELTPYHQRLSERLDEIVDVREIERPGGVSDWSPIYSSIESEDCDVALIAMALGGTTAVNQWAQQERQFEMGGIHVPAQAYDYWESTGGNVEHVFTMNAFTPQTENTPYTQDFIQEYQDRWDAVPMYTGALTYEAFNLIEQTIRGVVERDGLDELPDTETLIEFMEGHTYTAGDGLIGGTILEEFQFTPADAEYAHEPMWTSIQENHVPVFQQWQYDTDVRDDYGTMHSFAPEENQSAEKTVPEWMDD